MMRVAVVGQGYVGVPLSVRAAQVGHQVVAYDIDETRVKRLLAGESYIEDISDQQLSALLEAGTLLPVVRSPRMCRLRCRDHRGTDTAARGRAGPALHRGCRAYARPLPATRARLSSWSRRPIREPPQELVAPILEDGSGLVAGADFHLGYSPERIDPGNSTWTLVTTPKIVSGVDGASLAAVQAFYDTVVDTTIPVASPREAELAKLVENTFRHVNIALVNEIAMFAHELGIDVWEAIDAASTKPFGFMRFTPGPGVGGHCLPIDPSYLSWRVERVLGHNFRFVELANDINGHMPDHVVRRITMGLNARRRAVNGSRILLLGLSYKKNTGDARESPAVRVAQLLAAMGAEVRGADPHIGGGHPRRRSAVSRRCDPGGAGVCRRRRSADRP